MSKWADAIDDYTAWLTACRRSAGTIGLRRLHLRRLAEAHLRRSPWRITLDDLIGWMASHEWSPATQESYTATLRGFYKWAAKTKRIRGNPAADLPPVTVPRRVPKPTPDDVWTQAMARATDRDRLILGLGTYAGMRRAEIAGCEWTWILPDHIRVTGKGGHTRLVPLHTELALLLDAERNLRKTGRYGSGHRYQPADDGGYVFPGRLPGTHFSPRAVGEAAAAVLGGGWSTHSTRHRFGTRSYAGTRDLAAVQELMGHTTPTTTRGYTGVSNDALRAAVNAI